MRKIVMILFFTYNILSANTTTLSDIKVLIEQNGKKIEQNGKKIELMELNLELTKKELDRRFSQVDERLDFMQNIMYLIIAAVLGVPLYLDSRRNRNDEELSKAKDKIKEITLVLKELAQDDPKIKRFIDIVGL